MPRRRTSPDQPSLLELVRTAPCVPAIRREVEAWRAADYAGATETARTLLNYWFRADHRLPNRRPFAYHASQRQAIETLIYLYEVAGVRRHKDLVERYAGANQHLRLPQYDLFARYGVKMATGSGKTKVMSLAIAWQYLVAVAEARDDYARTTLLIAPNVIVFERLKHDFAGGRIFRADPVIPPELRIYWDFECYVRGDAERAHAQGALYLTNIQQLYERPAGRGEDEEPEEMTGVLGPRPSAQPLPVDDFLTRIAARGGPALVINDEAHHTHDEESEWNKSIRRLHDDLCGGAGRGAERRGMETAPTGEDVAAISKSRSASPGRGMDAGGVPPDAPTIAAIPTLRSTAMSEDVGAVSIPRSVGSGLAAQIDFTATPRYSKGALFTWTVYDYPLKQAILDGIVKRPMKGIAKDIQEARSNVASARYRAYLTAGVERWREYREQLAPLGKKPILFVMMNDTAEADDVGDCLQRAYPAEFGGEGLLVIHTDRAGEVSKSDLELARRAAREVDDPQNPINAIVSVLMLREGWDVQNVTVVVGLRPYTSKANILPEQTIGRGLRLMFRDLASDYVERVDIIGNKAFIQFVEQLEREEDIALETFDPTQDHLKIITIAPDPAKLDRDITLPTLSPLLARKRTLAEEIAALDVAAMTCPILPRKAGDAAAQTFHYEGYDLLSLEKLIERDYTIPEAQTPQEVIAYYAKRIAQEVKLPSQFAALAPVVRAFLERVAFGEPVNLQDPVILRAINSNVAQYVTVKTFLQALRPLVVQELEPQLVGAGRPLSATPPFPYARATLPASKTVYNLVPCDNEFERAFARFLEGAPDVTRFAKLPEQFGFAIEYTDAHNNLRYYEPDFVAVAEDGAHYLVETKGREDVDVAHKDRAATLWCESATRLTGTAWRYIKVPQGDFESLQPDEMADLQVFAPS